MQMLVLNVSGPFQGTSLLEQVVGAQGGRE